MSIVRLGDHDMAGSAHYPVTYRIRACPKCYGVLFWDSRKQTQSTCSNCNATVYMQPYEGGPIGYLKYHLLTDLFSLHTLNLICYTIMQVVDHRLRLRKLLLYAYVRGLSHL